MCAWLSQRQLFWGQYYIYIYIYVRVTVKGTLIPSPLGRFRSSKQHSKVLVISLFLHLLLFNKNSLPFYFILFYFQICWVSCILQYREEDNPNLPLYLLIYLPVFFLVFCKKGFFFSSFAYKRGGFRKLEPQKIAFLIREDDGT